MRIGTRSVLYGAHCFLLHPWFVAAAWWRLYGFPWDPRLWVAFFVHDIGYLGKPNMDGPEGERHVELGAQIMAALFDHSYRYIYVNGHRLGQWGELCLFHSRFYAKKCGCQPSCLCLADKLAIALTPALLYLPLVRLTGEVREYRYLAEGVDSLTDTSWRADLRWYRSMQSYMDEWVEKHKHGERDTWTRARREVYRSAGARQ